MKIFVPQFRQDFPPINNILLENMFAEIDGRDLEPIIEFWKNWDQKASKATAKDLFRTSIKKTCKHPIRKNTLEPYLRRPHITIHCGAKTPAAHCRELAMDAVRELGRLVALHGFNLWYGGGDQGLMGAAADGFVQQVKLQRFPDQYSAQIIPGQFVVGVESANGLRPANEGLSHETDIALVMPEFVTRRELLDSKCAAAIAAFGSIGTLDELTDVVVHVKTGLRTTRSYILNTYTPELKHGYWYHLEALIKDFMTCGLENNATWKYVKFLPTPEAIFSNLMQELDLAGKNPHTLYAEYCREHGVSEQPTSGRKHLVASPK